MPLTPRTDDKSNVDDPQNGTHYISVDLGGTKTAVSLCRREGFVHSVREATRLTGDPLAVPRQIITMIDRCLSGASGGTGAGGASAQVETGRAAPTDGAGGAALDRASVAAVGVSSPGPFRMVDGAIVLVAPNMCGGLARDRGIVPNDWTEIPLEAELRGAFDRVVIANDAVSGAMAERTFGAGRGYDDLVYVTWSTGIGTGAYVDGRLIRGKNGNAPHGGHVRLVEDGPLCGCGDRGHLEALSSGTAIARDYGGGATAVEVFEAYRRGDPSAVEVVDRAARLFGQGLASINAVLDTRLFIIGGGVFMNNHDILLPIIREELRGSFPVVSEGVEIKISELGGHLGEMAGLSLVMPEEWVGAWGEGGLWRK